MPLEKLKIRAFEDDRFKRRAGELSVSINPDKYARSYTVDLCDDNEPGSNGASLKFNKVSSESISFELVFDGTGVVPASIQGTEASSDEGIHEQLKAFTKLVSGYDGKIHSPRYLVLSWGKLSYPCLLSKIDVTYTLFKPDGTPLRARANVTFLRYVNPALLRKEANNSSPDMSHLVTVKAGDTLPLLCHRIYGSSVHYRKVAAINGLTGFRTLVVGSQLLFPPLRRTPQ